MSRYILNKYCISSHSPIQRIQSLTLNPASPFCLVGVAKYQSKGYAMPMPIPLLGGTTYEHQTKMNPAVSYLTRIIICT